jgi:hypothetical protein
MLSRLVVAAVALVATLAVLDSLRGRTEASTPAAAGREVAAPEPERAAGLGRLVERAPGHHFRAAGGRLDRRVVIGGREYLGHDVIEAAFPGGRSSSGWINVSRIELAPDGTLLLALHRFAPSGEVVGAVQLWRARRLVSAFRVPARSFADGFGFARGGEVIATFAEDGRVRLYDRSGRHLSPSVVGASS